MFQPDGSENKFPLVKSVLRRPGWFGCTKKILVLIFPAVDEAISGRARPMIRENAARERISR
jgi:hypothetical protein